MGNDNILIFFQYNFVYSITLEHEFWWVKWADKVVECVWVFIMVNNDYMRC